MATLDDRNLPLTKRATDWPGLKDQPDAVQVGGDHYKTMAMQPWDVMEAVLDRPEFIGFLKGNIIKYSMRNGTKHGANDDGPKALHYKAKLDQVLAKGEGW